MSLTKVSGSATTNQLTAGTACVVYLKYQKQPTVMLSQGRASSETPEAASSDVEPGQGQF